MSATNETTMRSVAMNGSSGGSERIQGRERVMYNGDTLNVEVGVGQWRSVEAGCKRGSDDLSALGHAPTYHTWTEAAARQLRWVRV